MLVWLSVWSEMQTCIRPSWCHCHSLSLASVKSRLVLPFWYRFTQVVSEKGPSDRCMCVFLSIFTLSAYCQCNWEPTRALFVVYSSRSLCFMFMNNNSSSALVCAEHGGAGWGWWRTGVRNCWGVRQIRKSRQMPHFWGKRDFQHSVIKHVYLCPRRNVVDCYCYPSRHQCTDIM